MMSLGFLQDEKREHRRDSGDHRGVKGEEDVRHRHLGDREQDEHRERAQKANAEPGRNHRRETTKKPEQEKSYKQEAKAEVGLRCDGLCAVRRRRGRSFYSSHTEKTSTIT